MTSYDFEKAAKNAVRKEFAKVGSTSRFPTLILCGSLMN